MKVTKIALTGARLSGNLGGPSLVASTQSALSTVFPGAEYMLFVSARHYKGDVAWAPKYGIGVIPLSVGGRLLTQALIRRCYRILTSSACTNSRIKSIEEADALVDIKGILFADPAGPRRFQDYMRAGFIFVLGKLLGKPVIKYTADFGPFSCKWSRILARLYFGHFVDLILARSEESYQNVKSLGVKTSIMVVPDTAFLLPCKQSKESEHYRELRQQGGLIGVSVSFMARNCALDPGAYLKIMVEFVDYLIKNHGVYVVLIPNELSKSANDDALIAEQICAELANTHCEVLRTENLTAQEIKGVVSQCDVVVACRYHTIVAALSLAIPTLSISWHHKYQEVLKLFGQEHRVCDVKELRLEDLVNGFEDLWENREQIRQTIADFVPGIEDKILSGARAVHDIVSERMK
jgi:colanic acid/amylovoran biosynthesis protein